MAIVSSVLTSSVQADGRSRVEEVHTDGQANQYRRSYLAEKGADLNAALAAYAAQLSLDLAAAEIQANIAQVTALGSTATVSAVWSTLAQNRTALRAAFANATQVQAIMIGDFLASLTDAHLQAAFGLTAGQVATLRSSKLTPAASAAATIRAAAGQ